MATAHHGDVAGVGTLALLRDLYTCTLALCHLLWQVVCAAGAAGLCKLLAEAVRFRDTALSASAAALVLSSAAADAARRAVAQIEVMKPSSAAPRLRSRSTEGAAAQPLAAGPCPAQRRRSCPGVGGLSMPLPLLPPQLPRHTGRLTVVLDLDETLIAPPRPPTGPASPRSPPSPTVSSPTAVAVPRPGVHEFLARLSASAEVVLWTAAGPSYADRHLRALDPAGAVFAARVCGGGSGGGTFGGWTGVKDLSLLGRDLRRVVLVDNNVSSMQLQPQNGVPCLPFRGDPGDRVLLDVMLPLLLSLAEFDGDVRPILDSQIRLSSWLASRSQSRLATTPTSSSVPA